MTGRFVRMRAVAGGPTPGRKSASMLSCLSAGCASSCGLRTTADISVIDFTLGNTLLDT